MSVACGSTCTFYIDEYGDLFRCGVLNKKVEAAYSLPFKIPMTEPVVYVHAGKNHAAIITRDRKLYVFGDGEDGKLGTGFDNTEINPKQIFFSDYHHKRFGEIKTVICENTSTICLCEKGTVFASGSMKRLFFGIEMIAAAEFEALALSKDGNVFCWGIRHKTWTRHEHFNNELVTYIAGGNKRYVAITEHGNVYMWESTTSPKLVESENLFDGSSARVAACAGGVTYVVTDDGSLWQSGSLSDNIFFSETVSMEFKKVIFEAGTKIMSVSTSRGHTAALATDGELWTWGYNSHNQLGHENKGYQPIPQQISREAYVLTKTKHAVVGCCHLTQPKTEAMLHHGLHQRLRMPSDMINTFFRELYRKKFKYWEKWHAPQQKLELLVTQAKMSLRFAGNFLTNPLSSASH